MHVSKLHTILAATLIEEQSSRFIFDWTLTIGDVLNFLMLLVTIHSIKFAARQIKQTEKINRASLVKELLMTMHDNAEMRDLFYKIEWSEYRLGEFDFSNNSADEKGLDKLLSFFEIVCGLYERKVFTKADIKLFSYRMRRVAEHPDVQQYLGFLGTWQDNRNIGKSFSNYIKYCKSVDVIPTSSSL